MRRFLPRVLLTAALAASVGACAAAGSGDFSTDTTSDRYRVLIPDLMGPNGDRVAEQLRRNVAEMLTHNAVPQRDMRRAMEAYEIDQLDEITARQLAQQINAQMFAWGSVEQGGAGLEADVTFIDVRSGDQIEISDVSGSNPNELAQAIYGEFQEAVEGIQLARACNDYLSSSQFEQALETCNRALDIVPLSTQALYGRATALFNLERYEESLEVYQRLLELDPGRQDALLGAGLAASRLERRSEAMEYYNRYLEIDPGNVRVRIAVADDVAKTGDYVSAFRVLEPAMQENADDPEFLAYMFRIATAAGLSMQDQEGRDAARPFFETAMEAYEGSLGQDDSELDATTARQAIAVTNALGDREGALRLGRAATERFADEPAVWSQYASVLREAGQHDEAVRAYTRVVELDPEYQDIYIRRAQAYMDAGQRQQALADLERAAERGDRERVAQVIFNMASPALQAERFSEAAPLLEMAQNYATGEMRNRVNFFLGYSLFKQGEAIARANSQGNAADAERALAFFRRALGPLQNTNHQQAGQVRDAAQQYIENQEAIIRAARR